MRRDLSRACTGIGWYIIPKIDVLFAGTIRSDQGAVLQANWNAPNAVIAPIAGPEPLRQPAQRLDQPPAPGDAWGDRVNEIDLRIAKVLRFGRTRTNVGIDVYNLINSARRPEPEPDVQSQCDNRVRRVAGTAIGLTPRFVKISAQIDC